MNEDSIRLLREIDVGCKNAVNSFKQIQEFTADQDLLSVIEEQKKEHELIKDIACRLLENCGEEPESPTSLTKAMMWFTTEIKMMMDRDDRKAAELLADGCHMGIKSLSRYLREYKKAGQKERALAGRLMNLEMDLYKRLLGFL